MENKLNKLVINNQNLDLLEAKLNRFNPLNVLKVDEYEIRHSNILSWLLDPNENHGLGEIFFKKFVGEIMLMNEEKEFSASVLDIHLKNFFDLQLYRERKSIDILAVSQVNKFVLLIENKVKSKEHSNQLDKYSRVVENDYPGFSIIKVYLTLEGDEPSHDEYLIGSYSSILSILKSIMELRKSNLNDKVVDFISYYIEVLNDLLEVDQETVRLCKKIYNDNQEIIDYIFRKEKNLSIKNALDEKIFNVYSLYEKSFSMIKKHGITLPFNEAINLFTQNKKNIVLIKDLKTYACFIREDMKEITSLSCNTEPVYCIFHNRLKDNRMYFYIELQDFGDNYELRQKILKDLETNHGYKISKKSYNPESKYTRIYSKSVVINEITKENIFENMKSLYKNGIEDLDTVVRVCRKILN